MENTLTSQDWGELVKSIDMVFTAQAQVEKAYYDAIGRCETEVDDLLGDLRTGRRATAKAVRGIMQSSTLDEVRRIVAEFRRNVY